MSIKTFYKRPLEVKAIQFNGENTEELIESCEHIQDLNGVLVLKGIENDQKVYPGDYVILDPDGDVYKIDGTVFHKFYSDKKLDKPDDDNLDALAQKAIEVNELDSIILLGTKYTKESGTRIAAAVRGNLFASMGAVKSWLKDQEMFNGN